MATAMWRARKVRLASESIEKMAKLMLYRLIILLYLKKRDKNYDLKNIYRAK